MKQLIIPVEIEPLEDGGFFAVCRLIHGCHAVGATIPEALEYVEDVARILLELLQEDGLPMPDGLRPVVGAQPLREEVLVTLSA